MTFADPRVCLNCRGSIDAGSAVCAHCGVNLGSPEIQNAWSALVVADQWVARAREMALASAPVADPVADPILDQTPPASPVVPPRPVAPTTRSLSAGTVLLVIGAVSLLVAGLIFITVSWGSMGIVGRALSLLGFTAAVGALAQLITRRGLRGSAEALWTVFLGLLTLDWFAARSQDMFGLEALPAGYAAGVWGLVMLLAGVLIARSARRHVDDTLVAPSLAAGLAPVIGAGGVAGELIGDEPFWWAFSTAGVAAIVAALHARWALRPAKVAAHIALGILLVIALVAALVEALEHPALPELVGRGHGLPLLVVAAVAAGVARFTTGVTKTVAGTVSLTALAILLAIPAEHAWPGRGALAIAAAVIVVCALAAARTSGGSLVWRWAAGVVAAAMTVGSLPYLVRLVEVAGAGTFGRRASTLGVAVGTSPWSAPHAWWVPAVVFGGLGSGLLLARRWRLPDAAAPHLRAAAWAAMGLGAVTACAVLTPPAVALGGSFVVVGGLLAYVNRSAPVGWRHLGSSVVAIAPLVTLSSWPASLIVWPLAALVLAVAEWHESDPVVRWAGRGFAAWWASLVPGVLMAHLGASDRALTLAIIGAAVVVIVVGALLVDRDRSIAPVDVGGAAAGTLGLLLAVASSGLDAVPWTVAGAGVWIIGALSRQRRWCRWAGSILLGIAYVVRLADSGVDVVEAYTAPFAVILLGIGWWLLRRPEVGTIRALTPGVALALLPSLPQALDHPTSLRALLLGLVAVGFVGLGLQRRWKVPFVAGATVVLLLVLANVGPWALGLPRWLLFATLGAVAIGVGATWEARVRNGRSVVSHVSAMR